MMVGQPGDSLADRKLVAGPQIVAGVSADIAEQLVHLLAAKFAGTTVPVR